MEDLEEDIKPSVIPIETIKKQPADVIKKIADDWDEDEGGDKCEAGVKTEEQSDATVPDTETEPVKKPSRQSLDKSEDVDEDQIVADVDDILKDTDNIMSDVDTILSTKKPVATDSSPMEDDEDGGVIKSLVDKKKPTEQCEECYECFEDKEKLAWHRLNDH